MSISCFLKFGKREHLESLAQGKIHFSPVRELREREDTMQKGVGDKYEGEIEIACKKTTFIDSCGIERERCCSWAFTSELLDEVPVFCLTACSNNECVWQDGKQVPQIKPETLEQFKERYDNYDSVAVIEKPELFKKDMEDAFNGAVRHHEITYRNIKIKEGESHPIEIFWDCVANGEALLPNKLYTGKAEDLINLLFYKDRDFSAESEYRFVVTDEARKIKIATDFCINMSSPVSIYSFDELSCK